MEIGAITSISGALVKTPIALKKSENPLLPLCIIQPSVTPPSLLYTSSFSLLGRVSNMWPLLLSSLVRSFDPFFLVFYLERVSM